MRFNIIKKKIVTSYLNIRRVKAENLIEKLNKKQRFAAMGISLCLALFSIAIISERPERITGSLADTFAVNSVTAGLPDTKNFDFKHVERHEVSGAKATVVFIPQIHKEPTTGASSPKNDNALVIQKEIYGMLETLVSKNGIKYVMDETDLYGPMPNDKVVKIRSGLASEAAVKDELDRTLEMYLKNGGSQKVADQVKKNAGKAFKNFERNIYLTGGAAVLAANNSKAEVYGSQNEDTINEARNQLQNIVYMEERISQLEGGKKTASTETGNNSTAELLALLSNNSSNGNFMKPIASFAKSSQNPDLISQTEKVMKKIDDFSKNKNFETEDKSSFTEKASTSSNPYRAETNLNKLKKANKEATDKFMKLAKDQRSQEVADNMIKMLEENDQKAGILVLGAQHKDQLIEAFNKQGVSVIVVTPETERNLKLG